MLYTFRTEIQFKEQHSLVIQKFKGFRFQVLSPTTEAVSRDSEQLHHTNNPTGATGTPQNSKPKAPSPKLAQHCLLLRTGDGNRNFKKENRPHQCNSITPIIPFASLYPAHRYHVCCRRLGSKSHSSIRANTPYGCLSSHRAPQLRPSQSQPQSL